MKKSLINSSFHILFWFYVPVSQSFPMYWYEYYCCKCDSPGTKSKQTDLALKGFVISIDECSDKLSNDLIEYPIRFDSNVKSKFLRCFLTK